ncbi:MAG TPA: J domain-containing protein [Chloroflexota bacterium]|nr:J domain-containing protein [Chloroflexota bacterium]
MTQDVPGPKRPAGTPEVRRRELVDLYELLQISPRASQEVIQAAYRVLARYYHPDLNATPEAAQRIRDVNDAYRVLSDPQGRARYDLECSRAHRFERVVHADHGRGMPNAPVRAGARALSVRLAGSQQRPTGDRFTMPNGAAAVLGLLVVATLAVILLVMFSMSFDAPGDSNQVFDGRGIELIRR